MESNRSKLIAADLETVCDMLGSLRLFAELDIQTMFTNTEEGET